jgi:hypothetical protein
VSERRGYVGTFPSLAPLARAALVLTSRASWPAFLAGLHACTPARRCRCSAVTRDMSTKPCSTVRRQHLLRTLPFPARSRAPAHARPPWTQHCYLACRFVPASPPRRFEPFVVWSPISRETIHSFGRPGSSSHSGDACGRPPLRLKSLRALTPAYPYLDFVTSHRPRCLPATPIG